MGKDPLDVLVELFGDHDLVVEEFFARIEGNLRSGRIRMVFVADDIPDELMGIAEFLNEQMNPAEVFAVEVKQYKADGYPGLVIVPAGYGRTEAASKKSPHAGQDLVERRCWQIRRRRHLMSWLVWMRWPWTLGFLSLRRRRVRC